MLRSLIVIVLTAPFLCALIGAGPGTNEQPSSDPFENIQELLNKNEPIVLDEDLDAQILSIMENHHIPGVAVAGFCTDNIYFQGYYGYAQIEEEIPVTDLTTFCIGSVSKVVTGTAGLVVVNSLELSLDAEIANYFDFEIVHPTCPDTPMTLRDVYTHTAGLPSQALLSGMTICENFAEMLDPSGMEYNPSNWPTYCPGHNYFYSGISPCLISCFAAENGGGTFPEFCRTSLFEPLGMNNTHWYRSECDPEHVAYGYNYNAQMDSFFVNPSGALTTTIYPANGLRTTATDLSHHTMAIMQGGRLGNTRILEQTLADEILRVQYPHVAPDQGLSWMRYFSTTVQDSFWAHFGGFHGYSAVSCIYEFEERNFGVVLMMNANSLNAGLAIIPLLTQYMLDNLDNCELSDVPTQNGPAPLKLHPNHPNPFNPQTTISFSLDRAEWAVIGVYDMGGRLLNVLADRTYDAGNHSVVWNGKDAVGRAMPSGSYVVRLETESSVEAQKVSLIK